MENKEFQTLLIWNLDTFKEFSKGAMYALKRRLFIEIFAIIYIIAYIYVIGTLKGTFNFFSVIVIIFIIWCVIKLLTRKGGLPYKRMLSNNNGEPPRNNIVISADGIHTQNLDNGNVGEFEYHRVRSIAETKNLIILMLEYQQGLCIDKRNLTGGTSEELTDFLMSACTNLKRRKVYTGKGSKIRKCVILFLIIVAVIFSLFQEVVNDNDMPVDDSYEETYQVSVSKMNSMSYTEIADELKKLGITEISDEMISSLEAEWQQFSEEEKQYIDKVTMLLTGIGCGSYDEETWEWTPSSATVYAFDMEFLNIESMYTEFLTGVSAVGKGDLDFSAIEENLDKVDWDNGTGSRSVKFEWKGGNCYLGAEMMNDWFDFSFADELNVMIAARCEGKQLYFGHDGYQMIYVFYCDSEWASEFEDVTGLVLSETLM